MERKYPNLELEIFKQKVTYKMIADRLKITERTLRNKLTGGTDFTWTEVCTIQRDFFQDKTKSELFEKVDDIVKSER